MIELERDAASRSYTVVLSCDGCRRTYGLNYPDIVPGEFDLKRAAAQARKVYCFHLVQGEDLCGRCRDYGRPVRKPARSFPHPCDAMAVMSNVMRCVDQALTCARFATMDWRILDGYLAAMMGQQFLALCKLLETKQRPDSTLGSEEWSRRVREGVKVLPKPGPVVTCQSEED